MASADIFDAQAARSLRLALVVSLFLTLAACAITPPPAAVASAAPRQWYAQLPSTGTDRGERTDATGLPHNGSLQSLSEWWRQENDPLLVELMEAAQRLSPSVASALSNIEQAQAMRTTVQAATLPKLDASAGISRSLSQPINRGSVLGPANLAQAGLQASWELDLFGANRAAIAAAEQRLLGTHSRWHEARVIVAAEVATQYYSLRACEKLDAVANADAGSRAETSRLTDLVTRAGFAAPATAALARASAADARSRATQQRAVCEVGVKAAVALTGIAEPLLRQKLATTPASSAQPGLSAAAIPAVPAELLGQRPDVFSAARDLAVASFEVGSAQVERYPRLSLTGSISRSHLETATFKQNYNSWSLGPLTLTLPIFDGGVNSANVAAARARYDAASGKYLATVRQAVREVEEALVNLQSSTDRSSDTAQAAEGYAASFAGTEARYKAGLASLVELEDSRRTLLTSQTAVITLEREGKTARVVLYRALGGGWSPASLPPPRTGQSSVSPQSLPAPEITP